MKRTVLSALFMLCISFAFSQTSTGKITGLKDAWGETITYIGDIKNKQPNGLGVAIYNNDFALRYAGYFLNGKYNGKGALIFKDGSFISGEWKNGKLNGKGTNLNKDGDLFTGSFADGKKSGKGTFMYKDNSLLQGMFKEDKYEGRCVYIPAAGATISDNIYVDGKKNGPGYQYEVSSKKLFEGIWKNGDWVEATTGNYSSFLKADGFYGEKTDKQILMGPIKKTTNLLYDTAFYYDLTKKKRYFGFYNEGNLDDGIIIRDDSTRFIGKLNDDGATGYCSFYKVGKFYDEGTYLQDYLNGNNSLSIDLADKTIYYGQTTNKGEFTGKSWFSAKSNALYNGDYKLGKFSGSGYKIKSNGYCIRGTWDDGVPLTVTSITDDKGMPVSLAPKTLADAISIIANQSLDDLDIFKGADLENDDYDSYALKYESILKFPGAPKEVYILDDEDFYINYIATYLETSDFEKAKTKYMDLCKQLDVIKISLHKAEPSFSLDGTPTEPDEYLSTNSCVFYFPDNDAIASNYAASVVMVKDYDDNYSVSLVLSDADATILYGDE